MAALLLSMVGLAACDEGGGFSFPSGEEAVEAENLPANALNQRVQVGRDIERPDIFEVTDRGLWDGRPSLGGAWVAHPDVEQPDRVVIRNNETGRSIVGALFRRERENPGPLLQVSSDAAESLGMLPGAPTELSVVVLRRAEVEAEPEAEINPVIASLEAPVSVEAATLDPVDTADGADAVALVATAAVATTAVLPPAVEAATAAAESAAATSVVVAPTTEEEPIDVSAVLAAPVEPLPDGTIAQIGVFSVEANADAAAQTIIAAGFSASVLPEEVGGRTVWRVVAGPLADSSAIAQLQGLGFLDAFIVEDTSE